MSAIVAGEIKKRGVSAFASALKEDGEAVITVHGKGCYVVMTMQKYNELREIELAHAAKETSADYEAGRIADETIEGHMRRLDDAL